MKTNMLSKNQIFGKIAVKVLKEINELRSVFYLNYYVPSLSETIKKDFDAIGISCEELSNFFTWFNWKFRQKKFYTTPNLFKPIIPISQERIYEIAFEVAKNIEKNSQLISGYSFNSFCKRLSGISGEEIDVFVYECSKERLKENGIFLPEYEYL